MSAGARSPLLRPGRGGSSDRHKAGFQSRPVSHSVSDSRGSTPRVSLSHKQVKDPSPDQTARHSPPRRARTWQVQRTSAESLSGAERAAGRWKELCVVKKSKTSSPGWEGNSAPSETGTLSSPTHSQRCLREERREPTEEVCACCLSFHESYSLIEAGLLGQQYCKYTFKGALK